MRFSHLVSKPKFSLNSCGRLGLSERVVKLLRLLDFPSCAGGMIINQGGQLRFNPTRGDVLDEHKIEEVLSEFSGMRFRSVAKLFMDFSRVDEHANFGEHHFSVVSKQEFSCDFRIDWCWDGDIRSGECLAIMPIPKILTKGGINVF